MKCILLTGILLFNYCIKNIQLTFSESKENYQVGATTTFISSDTIVLIDFNIKNYFKTNNTVKEYNSYIKKSSSTNSVSVLNMEGWPVFTTLL